MAGSILCCKATCGLGHSQCCGNCTWWVHLPARLFSLWLSLTGANGVTFRPWVSPRHSVCSFVLKKVLVVHNLWYEPSSISLWPFLFILPIPKYPRQSGQELWFPLTLALKSQGKSKCSFSGTLPTASYLLSYIHYIHNKSLGCLWSDKWLFVNWGLTK